MTELSPLQKARLDFKPVLPSTLAAGIKKVAVIEGDKTECVKDQDQIKKLFANTYGGCTVTFKSGEEQNFAAKNVGVILSGGQAPGGHNVVAGLFTVRLILMSNYTISRACAPQIGRASCRERV